MAPPKIPLSFVEARACIQSQAFIEGPKYGEQQHRARRKGAMAELLQFEKAFIGTMKRHAIPMYCHGMVRTEDEQTAMYVRGVSKAKGKQGAHVWGCAADIVHGIHGWNIPEKSWDLVGHIGKEVANGLGIKIVWGGDWRYYDPAHWELEGWREFVHVQLGA